MTEYVTPVMYAYIGSPLAWTDITGDVIGVISGEWGIQGSTPLDRIADTGTLTFTLNNITGKYSPDHTSALAGWRKGTLISFYLNYETQGYNRFYGAVENIDIASGVYGKRTVTVTAVDWMDRAAEVPLDSLALQQNKTADQAIGYITANMPRQPNSYALDAGNTTFQTLFDTLDGSTRAYTELAKIANSELGYIYIRKSLATGETLVFENSTHRSGLTPLSQIPIAAVNSFNLLKEDGDLLLLETGDSLLIDELENAVFDNSMMNLGVTYGQDLINKMKVEIYPKRTDTSAQILFSLDSPMQLAPSGVDVTFEGYFTDPTGGDTRVTGINMIAPVITTDYKMWTNSDGTGTDITASLVITAVYKADRVIYTVRNNHATLSGYITLLQARGYGIYSFNPIQYVASNAASIIANGEFEATLEQKYQVDLAQGIVAGDTFLDEYKDPQTVINSMTCNANRNGRLMEAFLNLDIGDLIQVKETQSAIDRWAWIQNIRFELRPGGLLNYTYGLKEHHSLASGGLELVEVEPVVVYDETTGPISGLNYGYQARVSNLQQRTITLWAQRIVHPEQTGGYQTVFAINSRHGGIYIDWNTVTGSDPATKLLAVTYNKATGNASYSSDTQTAIANDWHLLTVTTDWINELDSNPGMWIDGVASTSTKSLTYTGTGAAKSETGAPFAIGNRIWEFDDWTNQFPGKIKDVRIYNRVLTQTEITAIYNAGAGLPTVSDGLVFQGPCIHTARAANYAGAYITADDKLIDNIYGAVGNPMVPSNIKITVI